MANTKSKKVLGSELSSTRDSEERSSVPAMGRGQKRGRDNEIEKVCSSSLFRTSDREPSLKRLRARSVEGQAYDKVAQLATNKAMGVKCGALEESVKIYTAPSRPTKSEVHKRLAQYMKALRDSKTTKVKTTQPQLTNGPVKKRTTKKNVGAKRTAKKTKNLPSAESTRLPVFSLDWDIPEGDRCDCYDCCLPTPLDLCQCGCLDPDW